MNTPVAVTLIFMGSLLVMTPVFADYLHQCNVVELLSKSGASNASLAGQMSEMYRLGCWLTGSGMVGVAVFSSLMARRLKP